MQTQGGARRKETEQKRRPSLGIGCTSAYVSIAEGGQTSEHRSHVNTWEEERTTDRTSVQKSRALSDTPGAFYHFSVLRVRF